MIYDFQESQRPCYGRSGILIRASFDRVRSALPVQLSTANSGVIKNLNFSFLLYPFERLLEILWVFKAST